MGERLSEGVCEAVARDFLSGSVTLAGTSAEEGDVHYEIEGDYVSVRHERGRDVGVSLTTGLHMADFIGGVTFALAAAGEIPEMTANPQNVAMISYMAAQMLDS